MSDELPGQDALFPNPLVPRPRMAAPRKAARYERYRVGHLPCDACIRAVHLRGLAVAEPLRTAAWKRTRAGEETEFYCEIHKSERQASERE